MSQKNSFFHDPLMAAFEEQEDIGAQNLERTEFEVLSTNALSRRHFIGAGLAFGVSSFVLGVGSFPSRAFASGHASRLQFEPVVANGLDTVTVPRGYSWDVVVRWGDPLWSDGSVFDQQTRGTGASQERAFGDNNDGMAFFAKGGRTVLAVNNEYTNRPIIYGNRESQLPENADDVRKGKAAHGVTVMEVVRSADGRWHRVLDSDLNRRITPDSLMELTGPARGSDWVKTSADPTGTYSLGTWNNCGNGRTPWGTFLTCEENFNGYFSASDPAALGEEHKRYGIKDKDWGYGWVTTDDRFDVAKHPNEVNRAGYIVEIDPFDPTSTPKKRTALGRFKHENAELVIAHNGHVVVYMGDDERGEFLYRFVSAAKYSQGADNSNLLEDGTLYVAKFDNNGSGRWIELTPAATGMASKAEIAVHTRQAASAVGATTMDRPEWVSANPKKSEVYCCLTNNKNRGKKPNAGGDETPAEGPNPRASNNYGQIVRWRPASEDHTAETFSWDLYVVAGNPTVHSDAYAGSSNITADNMFNSPDGLAFDSTGMLWIQTDGKYSNKGDFAGQGNNQMLVGDPDTGEIRRFMVGPNECEITGITWSSDRRTLFVGIQHPGEEGGSHFPDGGGSVPRSAVISITRDDGGLMG
ncbi:MAG: PhoX family phosphatase [Gammaproteobacteria bacterium]|nr:PhoX family phosphatase [Gammaproteobacteria bacterium]